MTPRLDYGHVVPAAARPTIGSDSDEGAPRPVSGRFEGILETLPLAEVAQAIPFLVPSGALSAGDVKARRGVVGAAGSLCRCSGSAFLAAGAVPRVWRGSALATIAADPPPQRLHIAFA